MSLETPEAMLARGLLREVYDNDHVQGEHDATNDVRMAREGENLERKERAGRHDHEPRPPPSPMEKGPAFDQRERPVGQEGDRQCP